VSDSWCFGVDVTAGDDVLFFRIIFYFISRRQVHEFPVVNVSSTGPRRTAREGRPGSGIFSRAAGCDTVQYIPGTITLL
jgi:hypothetical protein